MTTLDSATKEEILYSYFLVINRSDEELFREIAKTFFQYGTLIKAIWVSKDYVGHTEYMIRITDEQATLLKLTLSNTSILRKNLIQ